MNLKDMRLSQRSQTQKNTVIPFYEVPRGVRFIATENKMVGCQGLGAGRSMGLSAEWRQTFNFAIWGWTAVMDA